MKGNLYQENSQNTKLHLQKLLKKEDRDRKTSWKKLKET